MFIIVYTYISMKIDMGICMGMGTDMDTDKDMDPDTGYEHTCLATADKVTLSVDYDEVKGTVARDFLPFGFFRN
jgi:hypothetical protein